MKLLCSTTEICGAIEKICQEAKEKLILISPFIKFTSKYDGNWDNLITILTSKAPKITHFAVLTKATTHFEKRNSTNFFIQLGAKFLSLPTLHTKLVLSESGAVFSSMNLYQYSAQNNYESGILVEPTDETMFQEANQYVESLLREAEELDERSNGGNTHDYPNHVRASSKQEGYCIICGNHIILNLNMPICRPCYQTKRKYRGKTYGKQCHRCGMDADRISQRRPLCRECYYTIDRQF
ncbi:hypothetical protein [Candidatus Lokiarchaeum ossiferum]|uniref:hypothetical protein n=1 Tax=Candidatus Lokiarchaeum ossiferum TaxID=2951803 RepID=UPI00352E0CB2